MKLLRLLTFPISRLKVDDSVLPNFEKELELELKSRGTPIICSNPTALIKRLVQEAYFRAGIHEPDNIPRNGPMEHHIEDIAGKIALILAGDAQADETITKILLHWNAIPGNATTKSEDGRRHETEAGDSPRTQGR